MAQYTSNIGLHQWEPGDNFLRTEFNQDFAKIDAAFGDLDPRFAAAETARGWLEDAVARMGYEALQSRLSAHAEGKKSLPAGRGLLLDSFRTGDALTLTGGCGMKDGGGVQLDTVGLTDFEEHFGLTGYTFMSDSNSTATVTQTFTASGNGILEAMVLNLRGNAGDQAEVAILEKNQLLCSAIKALSTVVSEHTFPMGAVLKKGTVYTVRLRRLGERLWAHYGSGSAKFGYRAVCTSAGGTSGSITTTAQMTPPFRTARAWVRHSGGTIGCALQRGNGGFTPMRILGTRQSVECRGSVCTETEFELAAAARPSGGAVSFQVSIQSGTDADIYDFGAALI